MKIIIDPDSGFCFGVRNAIHLAEEKLVEGELTCLGEMVHNEAEVARLEAMGMRTFLPQKEKKLPSGRVLIRAHGEPPETYVQLREARAKIIDATCPIVLKLQQKIKEIYKEESARNAQILIFGKPGHPEIIGLNGQTNYTALIMANESDFEKIAFDRPAHLFSQTTMDAEAYQKLANQLSAIFLAHGQNLTVHPSTCRQVSGRVAGLRNFVQNVDVVVFVSGKNSSNGKALYEVCKTVNPRSFKISVPEEIDAGWFFDAQSCGISGATSTPPWLLVKVAEAIKQITT